MLVTVDKAKVNTMGYRTFTWMYQQEEMPVRVPSISDVIN